MFGDLIQLTVPPALQWIAIIAGIVAALRIIFGFPIRWTSKLIQEQANEYVDERVDEKLKPIIDKQREIDANVQEILARLSPNGGDSPVDKINAIAEAVLPKE